MNQIELIVAAKQRQGLTSDGKLALRLGVTPSRVSQLARNLKPADEAEIAMLADMAGIDLHVALAAVHKDREKNPAKREYWQRLLTQFAVAGIAGIVMWSSFPGDAYAELPNEQFVNYANAGYFSNCCVFFK